MMKTQRSNRASRAVALFLAFMMTLVFIPTFSFASYAAEGDSITVFLTVSDQGELATDNNGEAMAWRDVTVTDLDGDGHYTFDEVLVAAHEMYNSADGYAKTSSGQVTKLWGKETTNTLFFINDEGIPSGVTADTVSDEDYCVASINADQTYYADWYTFFDQSSAYVGVNEEITLNLSGHLGMAWTDEEKANKSISGAAISDTLGNEYGTTDENGDITLSFDKPGMYVVTAGGYVESTATDYNLMDLSSGQGWPRGTMSEDMSVWNVAYTDEDYGDGPYPADEIQYIDFFEEAAADSENDYAWEDLNYLKSNVVITDCPMMAPACVITVDPAPLDYDGEEVNFIKEDGSQYGMFTPQEGTTAKLEGEDLIIHYVPKNKTVYSGFSWGSVALPDYADESVQPGPDVEFNEDGTFDLILDISDCGTAYPIAVIKKSFSKGSWTSADQYYLAIPTSDHFIAADYSAVDAAIAKVPKDMSKYTDASVKAVNDAVKAVVRGKMANEQAAVDNMAKAINNAVAGLKAKEVKKGWKKENGSWYYYNNDGTAAKNTWKKDSKGWCYLGSDGKMVANGWAKDSKGTVWMNGSGYWDNGTKWIKSGGNWYHITKGYMDKSKWMKDSKGWCYLGKDGKMVTNGWAKDSHGWCWMGSNGYWTSNKWVKDKGEWYYIKSNHYMASNEWAKDSKGWMYMAGNGKVTKSKWVKSGGDWYYLKDNGYMATGTLKIGSKTYRFNSAGKWIQ